MLEPATAAVAYGIGGKFVAAVAATVVGTTTPAAFRDIDNGTVTGTGTTGSGCVEAVGEMFSKSYFLFFVCV